MSKTLIDYYLAIEDSSRKMLSAAESKNWDQVVQFEGACAVLIEQLRLQARSEELLPEHRAAKVKIMQRILMNDAQIRYLAEPWLEEFERTHDEAQVWH
jgi:flagellar protein FliT